MNASQYATLMRIPMRQLSRQTRYALEGVGDKRKSTHASDSNGRGRGGLSAPGRVSQSAGEGGGGPRVQPGRLPARLHVAPGGKLTARNDRKARGCLDGDN